MNPQKGTTVGPWVEILNLDIGASQDSGGLIMRRRTLNPCTRPQGVAGLGHRL